MEKTNIRAYTLQELANVLVQHGKKHSGQNKSGSGFGKREWPVSRTWPTCQKSSGNFGQSTLSCKQPRSPINRRVVTVRQNSASPFLTGTWLKPCLSQARINRPCASPSQVGCKLKCSFCATGGLGFTRNLLPEEIFDQVVAVKRLGEERGLPLSNIVLMGMGEPLLNYENVLAAIERITAEDGLGNVPLSPHVIHLRHRGRHQTTGRWRRSFQPCHLAPLGCQHDPDKIMPINKAYPLTELAEAIRYFVDKTGDTSHVRVPVTERCQW